MYTRVKYMLLLLVVQCIISGENKSSDYIVLPGERPWKVRFEEEDDVVVLTGQNFKYAGQKYPRLLVNFYTTQCSKCEDLITNFTEAAKVLKSYGLPLAKIKITKHVEEISLAKHYGIHDYPTLALFIQGVIIETTNARTVSDIVNFMMEKADYQYESYVLVLGQTNFSHIVKREELILVNFYTYWCHECRLLAPKFEAAAMMLRQSNDNTLAKVDGMQERSLIEKYKVNTLPTLKLFRYGRECGYDGPRTEQGIVSYMKEMRKLPSKEVSTISESKNCNHKEKPTIFGFFKDSWSIYNAFIDAANVVRGRFNFAHTFKKEIAEYYGVERNTIILRQPKIFRSEYEEESHKFNKESGSIDDILDFIGRYCTPLVGHRTKLNQNVMYWRRPLLVLYYNVYFSGQYLEETQHVRQKILPLANELRNAVTFAVSNEDEYQDELEILDLDDTGSDVVAGIFTDYHYYRHDPDDELDVNDLKEFVNNVLSGKAKPHLFSQPVPRSQNGPIRSVVAKSFEDEVLKVEKDILLLLYAPRCIDCEMMMPHYEKLAKAMKSRYSNLIVTKLDGRNNFVPPEFPVKIYPQVYFIPAFDKKNPISFKRNYTFKNLEKFVNRYSSIILSENEAMGKQEDSYKDEF